MVLLLINNKGRTGVITFLCRITDSPSITIRSIMRKFKPYRKLWESHFGPIPKDELGRSYEIHHIDGDHTNNDIANLKLVTIQEHYDIHYQLSDWKSCAMIGLRMKMSVDEISYLNSIAAQKRINDETHHFLGESNPSLRRMKDGSHHFLNSDYQKSLQQQRLINKTHNFLGDTNPGKQKWECPHCFKQGTGLANAKRWHFENCKERK